MNNIEQLVNVFNTLCQIQISGYGNVTMLGGCMQTLKDVIEDMQREIQAEAVTPVTIQD